MLYIKHLFVGFKHLVSKSDDGMVLSTLDTLLDSFIQYDQNGFKHLVSSGNDNQVALLRLEAPCLAA
jgi:hypothetical protein